MAKRIAKAAGLLLAGVAVGFTFGEWLEDNLSALVARWDR